MKAPKRIDLKPEEMEALLQRVSNRTLREEDYEILYGMGETIRFLSHAVQEKKYSIRRLLRLLFGRKTESLQNVLKPDSKDEASKGKSDDDNERGDKGNRPGGGGISGNKNEEEDKGKKGHGRNGACQYTGAVKISVCNTSLKPGDPCLLCPKGKVYEMKEPGVVVRVAGSPPLQATVYERQRLRCNLCGKVFTAELDVERGEGKYDKTAGAMIALLKYGSGFPFNRLEGLQGSLGVPLSAATQWDIVEKMADHIHPVYNELVRQAAQVGIDSYRGGVIHNDDTIMKILELMGEDSERKGVFTTGILSIVEHRRIALFFTGRKHSGENMLELLKQRQKDLAPPIQMCDALSRNTPEGLLSILANCLAHARRNFVDIIWSFPEQCRHVIETLVEVYRNEQLSKEQNLSPHERLILHQENSGPPMEKLKEWLHEQFDEKMVEPNSSMGKAISYMLNHWRELTLFLRVENAPLDNNLCEQILKRCILHRKNALFYKTEHGAAIGDIFMSLIHTCRLNQVNPFRYLTTLYQYSREVLKNPHDWLPWNFEASVS